MDFSVMNLSNCSLNLCELLACTASCGSACPCSNYALCKGAPSLGTVSWCHLLLPTPELSSSSTCEPKSTGPGLLLPVALLLPTLLQEISHKHTHRKHCCIQDEFYMAGKVNLRQLINFASFGAGHHCACDSLKY